MKAPYDAGKLPGLEHIVGSTYIVRHDNTFDYPSTWAFEDYGQAAILRDRLNEHMKAPAVDGAYHVEEEPLIRSAQDIIDELTEEGWFDEC